jgi:AcrR family transcriptional regulator
MATLHRIPTHSRPDGAADDALLDAAMTVLFHHGFQGMTLDRVATKAGTTRVTLWRQGISHDRLIEGLIQRLARSYHDALSPVVTGPGTGCERLMRALQALCRVADHYLPLLIAPDAAIHERYIRACHHVLESLTLLLRDGAADRSLRRMNAKEIAPLLFDCVSWTYVHLRAQQHMTAERAVARLLDVVLHGVGAPEPAVGGRAPRPIRPDLGDST